VADRALALKRLLSTVQETPMLLSAPPLAHVLALKRLPTTYTGRPRYCDSARTAPPPMSGPSASQRLARNTESTIFRRPPRAKMAPPPPPSKSWPLELPAVNVRFWMMSSGVAWSWQCEVVQTCA